MLAGESGRVALLTSCRSSFHDGVAGTSWLWPKMYDGRAIITESYRDHTGGLPLEENIAKFKEAAQTGETSRQLVWW